MMVKYTPLPDKGCNQITSSVMEVSQAVHIKIQGSADS